MEYISTRDSSVRVSASQAIIRGISQEGGLFVPRELPRIDLASLRGMDYRELAYEILSKFLTDFPEEDLRAAIARAYDGKFTSRRMVELRGLGDDYFLELYHGPTLAFKDMALSILPHLMKTAQELRGLDQELVILTATSGDTGKAALEGFAGLEGVKIVVFYPEDGVSPIQKLQMKTQEGDNTLVVGIGGNFDDAQTGVKEIFKNQELARILGEQNYRLSSANSINIGRLLPQLVYYFYSYIYLLDRGEIEEGEELNIVVPTGNFGNILAAYYAREMGLPVKRLICASNENKVLTDFFETGIYDRRRELSLTSSPSMDILISSNLERLLHYLGYRDQELVGLMEDLDSQGYYQVEPARFRDFFGSFAQDQEASQAIGQVFDQGYLMDTHTAIGYVAAQKYREVSGDGRKQLIASTASPFKFARDVGRSLGMGQGQEDEFQLIEDLARRAGLEVPASILDLRQKEIVHRKTCRREDMEKLLRSFLGLGDRHD